MNEVIKGADSIGYADYLYIIFDGKCVEYFPELEGALGMTFQNVLEVAIKNGYEEGTILLLAESPLDGSIYRYGNYEPDRWVKVGTTIGYA